MLNHRVAAILTLGVGQQAVGAFNVVAAVMPAGVTAYESPSVGSAGPVTGAWWRVGKPAGEEREAFVVAQRAVLVRLAV